MTNISLRVDVSRNERRRRRRVRRSTADAGDGACRHEAATYVQQLAIFAPRVATPARLVPRLRASLFSIRPALRRAAAQTLKRLLSERDAGAGAARRRRTERGLEGDLLRFVDRFENGEPCRGDACLCTPRRPHHPAPRRVRRRLDGTAMRALAAVALPDAGRRRAPTSDETSSGVAESGTRGFFRSAPKLTTPLRRGAHRRSRRRRFPKKTKRRRFPTAGGRRAPRWRVPGAGCAPAASAAAGGPARAPPDAGVASRRRRPRREHGRRAEGRKPSPRSSQAQIAPAIDAWRGRARAGTRPAVASPEGARLAATATACGLDAGEARAARAIRAGVRSRTEAWLGAKETKETSNAETRPRRRRHRTPPTLPSDLASGGWSSKPR